MCVCTREPDGDSREELVVVGGCTVASLHGVRLWREIVRRHHRQYFPGFPEENFSLKLCHLAK